MKGIRNLFIGSILGGLLGWIVAFWYFPLSFQYFPFLMGLLAGLGLVAVGVLLWSVWQKRAGNSAKVNTPVAVGLAVLIAMIGVVGGFLMVKKQESLQLQAQEQQQQRDHQAAMVEAMRNNGLGLSMKNIFDKVDDELKDNPKRTVSEETIDRIAALSHSFKPYRYLEGEHLSEKKYSLERGQLLLYLCKMNLDSTSFGQIAQKANFAGAYLKKADLQAANLQRVNLREANLQEADLRGSNMKAADLWGANLWGAKLERANLSNTHFRKANLAWVNFKDAQAKGIHLSGADLTSAKLRNLDLSGGEMKWADLSGALLNHTNLAGLEMSGSIFNKANLEQVDLSNCDLRWTDFSEANLYKANFSGANLRAADLSYADLRTANFSDAELIKVTFVEENWFEKLAEWQVSGVDSIGIKYQIKKDRTQISNFWLLPAE